MQTKNIIPFIALLLFIPIKLSAQSVQIHGELPPLGLIEKTVYDTAYVKVYYEYSYRPDSLSMERKDGQTVLLIGDKCTGFSDYYSQRFDFINDSLCYAKRPPMELFTLGMGLMHKHVYEMPLVIDKESNIAIVQTTKINSFQYEQPVPDIKWQLQEGDTTLCDVPCRKAVCRFGGRDWTAWYAPSFSMPVGPYLFGGLPGLIFDIRDTKDNYRFSLNGLEHLKEGVPVYLKNSDDIVKTTREKARKAIENIYADVNKAFALKYEGGNTDGADQNDSGKRPYNPIELE